MIKMRMQIALDEERVKKEGKYSLEKLWEEIDGYFKMVRWVKEVLQDGSVMYYGPPAEEDHFVNSYIPFSKLYDLKVFADYATRWDFAESRDGINYFIEDALLEAKKEYGFKFKAK